MIPAKADPDIQNDFKKKKLEPRLEEAKQGSSFLRRFSSFCISSFSRIFMVILLAYLLKHLLEENNVLAALNAINHELITVTNDSYINSQCVCDLLWNIYFLNLEVPITLVLDNARYQKCKLVMKLAATLNIELLYLPSYSPNLNLIERLWKFVKKSVF